MIVLVWTVMVIKPAKTWWIAMLVCVQWTTLEYTVRYKLMIVMMWTVVTEHVKIWWLDTLACV